MLTWTHNQQKEIFVTTATTTWNLISWTVQPTHGFRWQCWSHG
jgi:hypothetical protein